MLNTLAASDGSLTLRRVQLQISDGPMELGIQLEGERERVQTLCQEIPVLARKLLSEVSAFYPLLRLKGSVLSVKARWPGIVQRMILAVQQVDAESLTPMAAVAGSISEEILLKVLNSSEKRLSRIIVNNGGDMAVFSPFESLRVGIRGTGFPGYAMEIPPMPRPYGIATSGWRGRSFSQGIADAVVAVSHGGSVADAAATSIGNHVWDEDISCVERRKAVTFDSQTDIPDLDVTVSCGNLTEDEKARALHHGEEIAVSYLKKGLVERVEIFLQGKKVKIGSGMEKKKMGKK